MPVVKFLIWEGRPRRSTLPADTIMLRLFKYTNDTVARIVCVDHKGALIPGAQLGYFSRHGNLVIDDGVAEEIPIMRADESNAIYVEQP